MCKRIYKKYGIRITDDSGAKLVKLNKNVDMTSFRNSQKVYSKTKKMYEAKNEDITVELVGITQDDEVGNTIYSKQFMRKVENANTELLRKTDDIVDEIKYLLNLLQEKKSYHEQMKGMYDKKRSLIVHKLESLKKFNGSRNELIRKKLEISDALEEVCHKRRYNKNESKKLNVVYRELDMVEILNQFNDLRIPIEIEDYEYINEDLEKKVMMEYNYSNDSERDKLLKQLENEYAKIVIDSANSKIIAYNNGIFNTNNRN